jgi:hypothetical protein
VGWKENARKMNYPKLKKYQAGRPAGRSRRGGRETFPAGVEGRPELWVATDYPAMSRKEWKEYKKEGRNVKKTERKKKRIDRKNPTKPQTDAADFATPVRAGIQKQAGGIKDRRK